MLTQTIKEKLNPLDKLEGEFLGRVLQRWWKRSTKKPGVGILTNRFDVTHAPEPFHPAKSIEAALPATPKGQRLAHVIGRKIVDRAHSGLNIPGYAIGLVHILGVDGAAQGIHGIIGKLDSLLLGAELDNSHNLYFIMQKKRWDVIA